MMFWINGGNAAACQLSPLVTSVITPVSKLTSTSSVEDTRERGRDNAGNAVLTENKRCVLTGGAAAEVAGRDNDVARVHILDEIRVDVLHCVGGQLLRVCDIQITCGDDNVGIDIIAVLENLAFCVHGMCFLPYFRSSGAQI